MSIKTSKLLLVDLELTDADVDNIEIIEIGLCLVDMLKSELIRSDEFLIRPNNIVNLSDRVSELTGIKRKDLKKKGKRLYEALNSIKKKYPLQSVPWAAWGTDNRQLALECYAKGILNPFTDQYINVSSIYAFMKQLPKGIAMEKALAEFGMEFVGVQHSAKDDAINLGRLVLRMFNNVPEIVLRGLQQAKDGEFSDNPPDLDEDNKLVQQMH